MQPWIVRLWLPYIFLLFLFVQVNAVRLDECKAKFVTGQSGPVNLTYHQCVETCGGGLGDFRWSMFSPSFSTWLLPWIALIFQLPFGATDRVDNLVSVFLAIGSPVLAGYSLAITHLNSRWLSHQFAHLTGNFPNGDLIPLALSALQHIPFRINASGSLLPSLIVLPQNDQYWEVLGEAAKDTRQWSIPLVMNIVWVLVAFSFTITDSFADFHHFIIVPGDPGYSIATAWMYLFPLVIGWLHVGCQPGANHLFRALNKAHNTAYVTTTGPVLATQVAGHPTRAIMPSTGHVDHVNADEVKTTPIFNYSRVFIWSQSAEHILRLYKNARSKADRRITVRGGVWDDGDNNRNRIGNREEVIQYCKKEDTPQNPTAFPPSPASSAVEVGAVPGMPTVFATGVSLRVIFATVFALGLQWGTTGASIIIHLNTPPKGLGCRALTFIVYGAAATVAFLLLLFSSIVSHFVRRQNTGQRRLGLKALFGYIAALTRWLGKLIAITNGFGFLVSCILRFAGAYDNCFCSSTILGGNPNGLLVSFVEEDIKQSEVYGYWIGGTIMASMVSILCTLAIYVATPM